MTGNIASYIELFWNIFYYKTVFVKKMSILPGIVKYLTNIEQLYMKCHTIFSYSYSTQLIYLYSILDKNNILCDIMYYWYVSRVQAPLRSISKIDWVSELYKLLVTWYSLVLYNICYLILAITCEKIDSSRSCSATRSCS